MRWWDTAKYKVDTSLIDKKFGEYKSWLKLNDLYGKDMHIDTDFARTFFGEPYVNDQFANAIKKEEEEMAIRYSNTFENNYPNDISVTWHGETYIVDSYEIDMCSDVLSNYPICQVKFVPSPSNRIKDSRCTKCPPNDFRIDKVTFNGPATIVNWKDGTKTIVKCDNESFDPEKGLAMAIVKKVLGNKGNYYNAIRKALDNARYYDTPVDSKSNRFADAVLAGILAGIGLEKKMEQGENKCE